MSGRRHRISSRTIASFASTLLLTALVAIVFGLDWRAALWGRSFDEAPPPPIDKSVHFEYYGPATGRGETTAP